MYRCIGFFVFCLLGQASAMPQVYVKADTTIVTLGQPLKIELKIEYPLSFSLFQPDLRLIWSDVDFELTELSGPITVDNGQRIVLRGNVQFFEIGEQTIPSVGFLFLDSKNDTVTSQSFPLTLFVKSVLSQDENEIRDIKPPVFIAGGFSIWLVAVVVGLLLICIGAGLYFLIRRYRRRNLPKSDEVVEIDFSAEFNRIAQMGLLEKGEIKKYYSLLSDNLRKFLEKVWVEEAMEKTTGEIEAVLRKQNIDNDLIRRTGLYLSTADLVKFARFFPDSDNADHAPRLGLDILHSFEKLSEEQEENRVQLEKSISDAESKI